MQVSTVPEGKRTKPRGCFELAPEFERLCARPMDVIYDCCVAICRADENGSVNIRSQLLRGNAQPQGYVDVWSADHTHQLHCRLTCSVEQARDIAAVLLAAADDVEAALAELVAGEKQGGAA